MGNWLEAGNEYNAALFVDKGYDPARRAMDGLKSHLGDSSGLN